MAAKDAPEKASTSRGWFKGATVYFRLLLSPGYSVADILLLIGGVVFAIGAGIPFPLLGILFGQLINDLNSTSCDGPVQGNNASLEDSVRTKVLYIVYITIANWFFIYINTSCFSLFGERLVRRLRERYLSSLLRQELAFFDTLPAGDVSSRLSVDLEAIQTGTSEKVGICISSASYFVAAYIVAFIKDSTLAGILVSLVPAYFLMAFGGSWFIKRYTGRVSDNIASGTAIVSESLNKLMVVHAFGAGTRLEAKLADYLHVARNEGVKKAVTAAVQLGLLYFIAYSTNALAYWQGSRGIAESVENGNGGSRVGAVYTVIFLLIDASFIISQVAPFMQIFGTAAGASDKLNGAITRHSAIDGTDPNQGERTTSIEGDFELSNVSFAYPGRPDTTVIHELSLSIPAGKHTAIVGQSGSGKSTVAALLARLYDPSEGSVLHNGQDIRELNVKHLRSFIGTVTQDPNLLDRSILENISHGLINSANANPEEAATILRGDVELFAQIVRKGSSSFETKLAEQTASLRAVVKRVREAAAIADANFVDKLEHGLATSVGSAGHQLSGGQKQRIALARALVRDPKILLLDEATSSLDSHSERTVQKGLKQAAQGRTTISIVHRLSSVKDADNIIVMRSGKVLEEGTHQELISADGDYASMVRLQNVSQQEAEQSVTPSESHSDDKSSSADGIQDEKAMSRQSSTVAKQPTAPETAVKTEDETKPKEPKRGVLSTIGGIAALTRPQALYLLVAFTAAAIVGGSYSGEAVIFGHTIGSLSPCNSAASIRSAGHFWGLLFFILAIIEFCANLAMGAFFGRVSEQTLFKIRILSFRTLMGQDVQWHESDGRTPADLLSFFSSDANALSGLTGVILGTLFSIIINTIAGIALSHAIAWRIAVVLLACIPVLLGAGIMRLRVFAKFHETHAKAFSSATGYATEAINSIKTIAIFSLEQEAVNVYHRALKAPYEATLKAILYSNAWLASAYSASNLVYALAYWWGSQNLMEGRYTQTEFFIVLPALLFSAQTCGQLFALAPDFSKSRVSAARILDLLDIGKKSSALISQEVSDKRPVEVNEKDIEALGDSRFKIGEGDDNGATVSFKNVHFTYPARPNAPVLQDLKFDIKPGQFCALVGPSGAGKSTIISLIERFYRPSSGAVEINGRDITNLEGVDFRDDIALVPQESVLFEGTLRFNLSLGARPNQTVSDAEIEAACRLANIHDTIVDLPDKYDTKCGPNANQFSGGQKQRLSIARALLRKPRLLLLDESTSALDSESEKLVQDALEKARKGVTVIAIAHRLHTIEKADRIFVIEEGRCAAQGTHQQLLQSSETYRTNALHQALGS